MGVDGGQLWPLNQATNQQMKKTGVKKETRGETQTKHKKNPADVRQNNRKKRPQ